MQNFEDHQICFKVVLIVFSQKCKRDIWAALGGWRATNYWQVCLLIHHTPAQLRYPCLSRNEALLGNSICSIKIIISYHTLEYVCIHFKQCLTGIRYQTWPDNFCQFSESSGILGIRYFTFFHFCRDLMSLRFTHFFLPLFVAIVLLLWRMHGKQIIWYPKFDV